jgi:hypothetical protein
VSPSAAATATPTIGATPTADATAAWTTYHSAANHLTFKHPNSWIPQECGWVFMWGTMIGVDNAHCPIDGSGGIILAASDNHQQGAFSTISSNLALYAHVQRSSVTVDGLTGTRITADQILGVGGGSSQIEYDFKSEARTYTLYATVKWPGYQLGDITHQFDQLVETVTFG